MKQDLEHMDPLLLRLRQQIEPTEMDIGLPSPGVWHAIQAANERRRKRRRLAFCLLFACITLGGFAISDLRFTHGSGLTIDDLRYTNGTPGLTSKIGVKPTHDIAEPSSANGLPTKSKKKTKSDLVGAAASEIRNPKSEVANVAPPKMETNPKPDLSETTIPELRTPKPETHYLTPEIRNPKSEIRYLTSEIRNLKSEIRYLTSEIRNPKSEIQTRLVPSWAMDLPKIHKVSKPLTFALRSGVLWTMLRTHGNDVTTVSPKRERSAWTWQHGLAVGQRLNKHWYWETGLQHTGHRLYATREVLLTFRSKQERFNPVAQIYTGTVQQDLSTAFGEVEMRYDINRVAGKPVRDQTPVKASFETDELVRYWRLPVALGYETRIKAFGWGLYGGVGANFLSGHRFDIVNTGTNIPAIRSIDARMIKQADELTKVMLDMHLGGDVYWWISRHCRLSIGLEGRQGMQSMYGSAEGGRTVPLALWPHIGIGIR